MTIKEVCDHQWSAWQRISIGQERQCAKCYLVELDDWIEDAETSYYRRPVPAKSSEDVLASRIQYLSGLPHLAEGWLSDGDDTAGQAPTESVVAEAIALLEALAAGGMQFSLDSLLLGPIPSGGVGMEIKTSYGWAMLQLGNHGSAEFAFEWKDDWQELPAKEAMALFKETLLSL